MTATTPDVTRIVVTSDGRTITRRCAAGHTYVSGLHADPVLLGAWTAGHEGHEGEK